MEQGDVQFIEVVKRFDGVAAVDSINLEVRSGEFFSLLGPSGCGKTTTLRLIGGFEHPTSGYMGRNSVPEYIDSVFRPPMTARRAPTSSVQRPPPLDER
jgi:ABC-type Fe3+/spermidine/putrescine transport system ATPase subunit